MSDMKCPFCNEEIISDLCFLFDKKDKDYTSGRQIYKCNKCGLFGSKELWQELIRTRTELEQSEICCAEWEKQALDYKAENIALSGDLECTRKALDVAKDALKSADEYYMCCAKDKTLQDNAGLVAFGMDNTIAKALEQITALEQKDK